MKHALYKQWIQLSLYDELDADQKRALDAHLGSCGECQAELGALTRFQEIASKRTPPEITENLLEEARRELRAALRVERSRRSRWDWLPTWLELRLPPVARIAFSSGVTLAIGVLIGYALFRDATEESSLPLQRVPAVTQFEMGETEIAAVKFLDADPVDGEVEFSFEVVRPIRVRGSIYDEQIQRVLARALLNERNPGVRLQTVSAIASTAVSHPDPLVERALIEAMKHDENPGVRKEAMKALRNVRIDEDIKQALLYVLANVTNEGLRIEAINSLSLAAIGEKGVNGELLNVLREKMQSDRNTYIRLRAKALLEEVKQQ